MDVTEARAITGRIRAWVDSYPVDDIKRAHEEQIWLPMGYSSWAEWCDRELDGFGLPVVERRKVVEQLPDMSNRAIADALGVSDMTIGRDRAATASNVAVDSNRQVTCSDGKKRPAGGKPRPRVNSEPVPHCGNGDGFYTYYRMLSKQLNTLSLARMTPAQAEKMIGLLERCAKRLKQLLQEADENAPR